MSGAFDGNASANDLGVHVRVGSSISAVPDPLYPVPTHLVRLVRREIDPHFVPLWANIWWKSPNGGLVKTGHHMLARHVRNPHHGAPVIKGLLLPSNRLHGIKYEQPILEANMLDGLTDEERSKGTLPHYVPFDRTVVEVMRWAMWRRNNVTPDERAMAVEEAAAAEEARVSKSLHSEMSYARHHDGNRLRRAAGKADRVYVSDTLVRLREIASGEAA